MGISEIIASQRAAILATAARHGVTSIKVFGSVARGDAREDSDVDFLVSFDHDAEWDLSDHVEIQEELSRLVGRPVDLLSRYAVESDANWIFRKSVLSRMEP